MGNLEWPQIKATPHDTPFLMVSFPLQGRYLPADHGFALYSAITQRLPLLHRAAWLGIELINGIPWDRGVVALRTRGAELRLRLPIDKLSHVLPLAGSRLQLGGHALRLGCASGASTHASILLICSHCLHQTVHRARAIPRGRPTTVDPTRHCRHPGPAPWWPYAQPPHHNDSWTQDRWFLSCCTRFERC